MLISTNPKNRYVEANNKIDKRTNGVKPRKEAVFNGIDVIMELLKEIKSYTIPAKTVLFDSWFSFPKTITNIVAEGFQVIAMFKKCLK